MTVAAPPRPAAGRGARIAVLAVFCLLVLGVIVAYALFQYRPDQGGALDPDSPDPRGSRALAVLLGNHDVDVDEVSSPPEAVSDARDGDVTVLVASPDLLAERTVRSLRDLPASVRVVFMTPDPVTLDVLDVGVRIDSSSGYAKTADPGCSLPEARSAGDAEVNVVEFAATGPDAISCYQRGLVVIHRPDRAELVILGAADPLTNERLAQRGNAALSLGLLSAHQRVLWLLPSEPETAAGEERPGLFDLLPDWVLPAVLLFGVAGVLAAFWRGRRLGSPVPEPLPVVVRSAETVEGRARLYRRARARDEAFASLRAAALARLLPVLGLGPDPQPRPVADAVADRSGRPPADVYALLYGPPPVNDRGLVDAADLFDALVRATLDPGDAHAPHRTDGEGNPQ